MYPRVTVFMFISGGMGVAVADAILNNLLLQKLPHYVPDIDPQAVLAVGAAGIKNAYDGDVLRGVRKAYLDGLHGGWAFGAAVFGVALVWALIPQWPGRLSPPRPNVSDTSGKESKSSQSAEAVATV